MSLKKYLLAGGLSTVLLLGACNGDGTTEEETDDAATEETEDTATDDTTEEDAADEADTEEDTEEEAEDTEGGEGTGDEEVYYSGEYGEFSIESFGQYTLEPEEAEEEEEEEAEEAEEAEPTELVLIEFVYTNNGDVPTSAEEAFGLELAVRHMTEEGEVTLDNLTMDLPEDHEHADLVEASTELLEPGESSSAVVAYGPVDTSQELVIQSRNDDELDETIELEESEDIEGDPAESDAADATDEDTDDEEEEEEEDSED